MTSKLLKKPLLRFYLVFGYILLFLSWWMVLLFRKNDMVYQTQLEIEQIKYLPTGKGEDFSKTAIYEEIMAKKNRQRIMIVSEGVFFMLVLGFGMFRVHKAFLRDMQLANQQRNFMLSITHELKSPLASAKLAQETLKTRTLSEEQKARLVGSTLSDIDRLETLVENILFAAKIEGDSHGLSYSIFDISELATNLCEKYQVSYGSRIQLSLVNRHAESYVKGDVQALKSVLMNILDNAIKYGGDPPEIEVSVTKNSEKVELQVRDNGKGIPEQEKHRIFEKFYRIGDENTRTSKGTGLGLYIVQRVVELHKGRIEVGGDANGAIFMVYLPKAEMTANREESPI